jgi:hypothetical protein
MIKKILKSIGIGILTVGLAVTLVSAAISTVPFGGTGVGTITGLIKGNGTSAFTAAVPGTDYAPATSGSSILKGNGAGGFSNATGGTDYQTPLTFGTGLTNTTGTVTVNSSQSISTLSNLTSNGLVKTSGSNGTLGIATAGTDYAPATSGSSILKGNGSGGFSNATSGTDYAPATSGSSILKGNGAGGFSNAVAGTDFPGLATSNIWSGATNLFQQFLNALDLNNVYTVPSDFATNGCAGSAGATDFSSCVHAIYSAAHTAGLTGVKIVVPFNIPAANWTSPLAFDINGMTPSLVCLPGVTIQYGGSGTDQAITWNFGNPVGHAVSEDYGCTEMGGTSLIVAGQTNSRTTVGAYFGGTNGAVGVDFHDWNINGFGTDMQIGANAYMDTFENIALSGGNGGQATQGALIHVNATSNSGERNVWDHITLTDPGNSTATNCVYLTNAGTASNFFSNVSSDDCSFRIGASDGIVALDKFHVENSDYSQYGSYSPFIGVSSDMSTLISASNFVIANDTSGANSMGTIFKVGSPISVQSIIIANYGGGTVPAIVDHSTDNGVSHDHVCQVQVQGGTLTNIIAGSGGVAWTRAIGGGCVDNTDNSYTIGMAAEASNTNILFSGSNTLETFDHNGNFVFGVNSSSTNTFKGNLILNGSTSGTTTIAANATASGTLTLPAATDTLIGKATTDTLTNKTFDTAGTGNVFKINGTQISAITGTGSAVLATSPTITGGTLTTSTVNGVTLTTGGSAGTFLNGAGSYTAPASGLTVGTTTIASGSSGNVEYNNGGVLGEMTTTGSGTVLALATSPSFTTPTLGAATATSLLLPSTATGITACNQVDCTTNFEKVLMSWVSNTYTIASSFGGTGTQRNIAISGGSNSNAVFRNASDLSGHLDLNSTLSGSGNVAQLASTGTWSNSAALDVGISIDPTINESSTGGYTGLFISPFESATGSGAKLLIDAGTNTAGGGSGTHTSKFSVSDTGAVIANTSLSIAGGTALTTTNQTGTGSLVLATSPSLTTPTLGVATATSINGNTFTTGTYTLTGTAGKTLTFNNSLTLAGTDGSTLNVGAGGTLGSNAFTSTAYAPLASPTFTGTVTMPTPFTLGSTSVTSTGTQLNYLNAATGTTGTTSGKVVFDTSPTITGATLTTASVNGVTLTTGGGTTTFLNANGTYTTPGGGSGTVTSIVAGTGLTGGTITTTGTIALDLTRANTWTGAITASTSPFTISGAQSASAWTTNGIQLDIAAASLTDTSSSGTVAATTVNGIGQPTLLASSATTYTDSSTLYIAGAPISSTNVTQTNPWALRIGAGNVKFPGTGNVLGTITSGTWNGGLIGSTYGGTGVNNGSSTITLGGNLTLSGAFTTTFTVSANTSLTLPPAGQLAVIMPQILGATQSRMLLGGYSNGVAATNGTVASGVLYALPFMITRTTTVTQMSSDIETNVTGNAEMGIYADNGNGLPGSLVLDAGNFSTNSLGTRNITGLSTVLTPGQYWVAIVYSATPGVKEYPNNGLIPTLGSGTTINAASTNFAMVTMSQAYGALPGTFSTTPTYVSSAPFPIVGMLVQ